MSQSETKGHIKIHADNILPIIKKWLYSEKEIFIRELVSNAADALTKANKLSLMGEVAGDLAEPAIKITLDKEVRTLTISDTGIGMTAEEMDRYINQVAFSGVQDFMEKYKDKDASEQVIGHFGLGFYSSFMVAEKVEIDSLSCRPDTVAAHWFNDGGTEFTIKSSQRTEAGTAITLHIAEDSNEVLEETYVKGLLKKYCSFVRYPVFLGEELINEPRPLWTKSPSELKDEDYLEFFRDQFPGNPDPLFWVHLNTDFPFELRGVLFFPKLSHELDASQGEVKLFCNQVYVAENTKELIPEFLTLLKGAIDCKDLPLNVSRSYLQNDPTVKKINEHITKKVADKLTGLAKTDRENFEKYWDDIHPFVKFGMMRDTKFCDRLKDHILFKTTGEKYVTLSEYGEAMKDKLEDGEVVYTSDETTQASYIRMLEAEGIDVLVAGSMIDTHFLPFMEMQHQGTKFTRVDSDINKHLVGQDGTEIIDPTSNKNASETIEEIFTKHLELEGVKIRVETLKSDSVPAVLTVNEQQRRMEEFSKMNALGAFAAQLNNEKVLVVNKNSNAVKNLLALHRSFNRDEEVKLVAEHIFDLARLQQGGIDANQMHKFVERATTIMSKLGIATDAAGVAAPEQGPEART